MLLGNVFDKSHAACRMAFGRFWRNVHRSATAPPILSELDFGRLEDRVLYSVSPGAEMMAVADAPDGLEPDAANDVLDPMFDLGLDEHKADPSVFGLDEAATQPLGDQDLRRELVFVDPGAQAYQQLVDDLLDNGADGREMDVFVLDASRDGVQQISTILAEYDDLDAVHIVSHGANGAVQLGDTWLGTGNLGGHAGQIATWRNALSDDADVLFYGCDLASSADGRQLVESVGALSGADVAASTDATGHADLGGDWDLEFSSGTIETALAVSPESQDAWFGLLTASGEILVNETNAIERSPDVAMNADGSFVVVWQSRDTSGADDWDVFARLYDPDGTPSGGEFRVNETLLDNQYDAAVATDDSGNFVVTWVSDQGPDLDVYARVFNSLGTPLTSEVLVGQGATTGIQENADVGMAGNGNFSVIWQGEGPGDPDGVFSQNFALNGTAIGAVEMRNIDNGVEFNPAVAVNSAGDARYVHSDDPMQEQFQIGIDDAGNSVVVGQMYNPPFDDWNIVHQRYDVVNNPVGVPQVIFDGLLWDHVDPSIAVTPNGDYVITWTSLGEDGDLTGVFGKAFLADGTEVGPATLINVTTAGLQQDSSVAANAAGNLVVAWAGKGPGDPDGVFVRVGDAGGLLVGTSTDPPLNEPPLAVDDIYTVDEGAVLNVMTGGVLDNDTDPESGALVAQLVQGPVHAASFTLLPDGKFHYRHDGSETTADSFVYLARDGQGGETTATVRITVDPVNDAPDTKPDHHLLPGKGPFVVEQSVLANDTDAEGDKLTAQLMVDAQHGDLSFHEDGTFTYTPEPGFFGKDHFGYVALDGQDTSDLTLVAIDVVRPIFHPQDQDPDHPSPSSDDTPTDDDSPSSDDPDGEHEDPTTLDDERPKPSDDFHRPLVGHLPITETTRPRPTFSHDRSALNESPVAVSQHVADVLVAAEGADMTDSADRSTVMRTATRWRDTAPLDVGLVMPVGTVVDTSLAATLDRGFLAGLNETTDVALSELDFGNLTVGAVGMMTVGLSVGYAFASVRFGNVLMSSLLATVPAWRVVDPLPVLTYLDKLEASHETTGGDDGDSLESIVDRAGTRGTSTA